MFYNYLSPPGWHGRHPDGVGVPPKQRLQRGGGPEGAGGGREAWGEPHSGRGRGDWLPGQRGH